MPVTAAHPVPPLQERRAPQTSSRTDRGGRENPVRGGGFSKGGCKNFSSCLLDASSSEQTLAHSIPFSFPISRGKKKSDSSFVVGSGRRARIKGFSSGEVQKRRKEEHFCLYALGLQASGNFINALPLLFRPGEVIIFFCKKTNRFRPLLRRGDESLLPRLLLLSARLPF